MQQWLFTTVLRSCPIFKTLLKAKQGGKNTHNILALKNKNTFTSQTHNHNKSVIATGNTQTQSSMLQIPAYSAQAKRRTLKKARCNK
jgi:hypothetical protein